MDEPPEKRKISFGLHRGHISVSSSERQSTQIIVPEESLKQLDRQAAKIEYQSAKAQWIELDIPWGALYPNNKFETFDIYIYILS